VLHRIADRFPRHVIVWPVRVQGEGSAEEVVAAIRGFNALEPGGAVPRPDVLIVARGGGSLEDLWSFNEEIVARAAAESDIPLVSAIGHETDWTLLDLVADIRAPTPTAAAEMVVPVRAELLARLRDHAARLMGSAFRLRDRRRRDFITLCRALLPAERLIEAPRQRLDLAAHKGRAALENRLGRQRLTLATLARRLSGQTPAARLARIRERLEGLGARLPGLIARQRQRAGERREVLARRLATAFSMRVTLERRDLHRRRASFEALAPRLPRALEQNRQRRLERLAAFAKLFASLNYRQVLARGFVIVRGAKGKPIRSISAIAPGEALSLEFADGRIGATGGEAARSEPPRRPSQPRAARARPDQGSLF
jgi:exodeoxyribonuclease VII large subunit